MIDSQSVSQRSSETRGQSDWDCQSSRRAARQPVSQRASMADRQPDCLFNWLTDMTHSQSVSQP
eukprot:7654487-Lingulodinium_polyedra.AAC.1